MSAPDIDAILAEIERLRALTTWQPVETAPKHCNVLLLVKGLIMEGGFGPPSGSNIETWCIFRLHDDGNYRAQPVAPTHWMPLPGVPR